MNRPVQVRNGGLYLRGLLEQGARKSLEPLVERLGEDADYQSMQQFLADSPWDPALVVKAVAERVVPAIDVQAWVLDDTGFPKDGKDSPGVKRQYSGTLGKTGNCQIGVSVHAVGAQGDGAVGVGAVSAGGVVRGRRSGGVRRRSPTRSCSRPSPSSRSSSSSAPLAGRSPRRRSSATAPMGRTPSCASGSMTPSLSTCCRSPRRSACSRPRPCFEVPAPRTAGSGRQKTRPRPDREPEQIGELIGRLGPEHFKTVTFRDGPDGKRMRSRFCFLRVRAAHEWEKRSSPRREEWLIVEWPKGKDQADRLLALEPPRRHQARAARPPRPPALEDRARLQATQGRARP